MESITPQSSAKTSAEVKNQSENSNCLFETKEILSADDEISSNRSALEINCNEGRPTQENVLGSDILVPTASIISQMHTGQVPPPSPNSMVVCVDPIPGTKVKIRFENNVWYGGTLESFDQVNGIVGILYDDGTHEKAGFPDEDIFVVYKKSTSIINSETLPQQKSRVMRKRPVILESSDESDQERSKMPKLEYESNSSSFSGNNYSSQQSVISQAIPPNEFSEKINYKQKSEVLTNFHEANALSSPKVHSDIKIFTNPPEKQEVDDESGYSLDSPQHACQDSTDRTSCDAELPNITAKFSENTTENELDKIPAIPEGYEEKNSLPQPPQLVIQQQTSRERPESSQNKGIENSKIFQTHHDLMSFSDDESTALDPTSPFPNLDSEENGGSQSSYKINLLQSPNNGTTENSAGLKQHANMMSENTGETISFANDLNQSRSKDSAGETFEEEGHFKPDSPYSHTKNFHKPSQHRPSLEYIFGGFEVLPQSDVVEPVTAVGLQQFRWVQCDNAECGKWRRVPDTVDVNLLPEKWYCNLNTWDPSRASCTVPEDSEQDLLLQNPAAQGNHSFRAGGRGSRGGRSGNVHGGRGGHASSSFSVPSEAVHGELEQAEAFSGGVGGSSSTSSGLPGGAGSSGGALPRAGRKRIGVQWVQCEKQMCKKWRKLPLGFDMSQLPEKWFCTMNTWSPEQASCDAPEDVGENLNKDPFDAKPQRSRWDHKFFAGTHYNAKQNRMTYRELIFGSDGRLKVPYCEKGTHGRSLFSDTNSFEGEKMVRNTEAYCSSSVYKDAYLPRRVPPGNLLELSSCLQPKRWAHIGSPAEFQDELELIMMSISTPSRPLSDTEIFSLVRYANLADARLKLIQANLTLQKVQKHIKRLLSCGVLQQEAESLEEGVEETYFLNKKISNLSDESQT